MWIHEQFGPDVPLNVGSGGTDVCTGLVQGGPLLPVWAGEMSGRCLGVSAWAYDEDGSVVVGELGELVITEPMPSMPVGLWGDDDGKRLAATYFEQYPGVMRFGDWIRFSEWGSCVITGRSDATLNRGGVRIGTAELYRVIEDLPGITDSLAVHLEDDEGGPGELILLVVTDDGGSTTSVAVRSPPPSRRRCHRGTCPTPSPLCRTSPATSPARSSSCPEEDPAGGRPGLGRQPRRHGEPGLAAADHRAGIGATSRREEISHG